MATTDIWESLADHEQRLSQLFTELAQVNERLDQLQQEIKDHQNGRDGVTPYRPHEPYEE